MESRPPAPVVRWGMIESVMQVFSAQRAERRYQSRIRAAHLRRTYEAAAKDRRTEGWQATTTSADAEISAAGPVLRDRMRDLVRNNPLAAQAVQVLVNNMVGYGIRARAASADPALNKRVNDLWKEWSKHCDAHGHTNFDGLLQLAVRQMIEGGEVFAVRRTGRTRGKVVPLKIELREADHLDTSRIEEATGAGRLDQGIEYDRDGSRAAYWMFPHHPGARRGAWMPSQSVRVPAVDVAHLFERQRVQARGVPWGTPAMRALRELGDWQDAELTRKKLEASVVGFVFGDLDGDQRSIAPKVRDAQGEDVEQFEPGLIAYVEGGKDIKFNQPSATPGIREWNLVQMHIIAAGFRVPYALMTGDLSQANFSSTRAGLNEFRRMVEQMQWQVIIPMFCERIWEWFIEAAWTAGLISIDQVPVEWGPPRFESVNPYQDALTDLLEVRAGFSSLPQQIAKRGYDTAEVVEEQAAALAQTDALGLVLDTDPRKTSRAGLTQARAPGTELPDTGAGGSGDET